MNIWQTVQWFSGYMLIIGCIRKNRSNSQKQGLMLFFNCRTSCYVTFNNIVVAIVCLTSINVWNFEIKCQSSYISYINNCWFEKLIFKNIFLNIYRSQMDYMAKYQINHSCQKLDFWYGFLKKSILT